MYDVYTEVSHYMEWIKKTILNNGGMAACGFTFSAGIIAALVGLLKGHLNPVQHLYLKIVTTVIFTKLCYV